MAKTLTLTIVIPAYNEERYLADCLESIADQNQKPDEVIVVDNNSTDRTAEIAKRFPFVTLLRESKQGIVYARNLGFDKAGSYIIGRIDADTHLSSNWVEEVKNAFSSADIAAATGDCYFYDFPFKKSFHKLHKFVYYILQKWIAGTNILWGSNMAVTKEAWNQVRSSTSTASRMHEDVDLSLKLKKQGLRIDHIDTMLAEVSLRRGDLSILSLNKYLSAWHHTYILNKRYIASIFILLLGCLTFISALLTWPFRPLIK